MSYRQIAEAASAPIGNVMSRLSQNGPADDVRVGRARQRLQDCLATRMKEASK
jgi:hypothetical protein